MPLPKPTSSDNRTDFMDRCMADKEAVADFPDSSQRFAVCNNLWQDRQKEAADKKK